MISRKLQSTGGSSYSITLPKKWIDAHKLAYAGQVFLIENNGSLTLLVKDPSKNYQTISLTAYQDKGEHIKRELVASYLAGYQKVKICWTDIGPKEHKAISDTLNNLIGFEVIEKTSSTITIKNVFDSSKFPVVTNLEKMFITVKAMLIDSCSAFCQNDRKLAQDVISRDQDVDRLYYALLRQHQIALNTNSFNQTLVPFNQLKLFVLIGLQLERIADHATKIAQTVNKQNTIPKQTKKQLLFLNSEIINETQRLSVFSLPIEIATLHTSLDTLKFMQSKTEKLFSQSPTSDQTKLVIDSIDRILSYLTNVGEFRLDLLLLSKAL